MSEVPPSYLRARELLIQIGFVELCCARAAFILRDKTRTVALHTLHVDDGLFVGDRSDEGCQDVLKGINSKFNI